MVPAWPLLVGTLAEPPGSEAVVLHLSEAQSKMRGLGVVGV